MSPENSVPPSTSPISAISPSGRHSCPCCKSAGTAEHGCRVEQQHMGRAVQLGPWVNVCASSGEDDTARPHQPGKNK